MTHRILFSLTALLSLVLFTVSAEASELETVPSSKQLVENELIYIDYIFEGSRPSGLAAIKVEGALFQPVDIYPYRENRKSYTRLRYSFNTPNAGKYIVPSAEFVVGTKKLYSSPISLNVHPQTALQKGTAIVEGHKLTYYTLLKTTKTSLYPNEHLPVEYKLYLPATSNVNLWGLPEADQSNCTAWRFETPERNTTPGRVIIKGQKFQVGSYHTTLTGVKSGIATFGPIKTRIVQKARILTLTGNRTVLDDQRYLSPALNLTVSPLPPNPPAGFKGAVGRFHMYAATQTEPNITDADSVKAVVKISGSGGLHTLKAPDLTADEQWNPVSINKSDLGKSRKSIIGTAEFTYLLQPTGKSSETPGFRFVFLDPILNTYRVLTKKGVPVNVSITPATEPETANSNTNSSTSDNTPKKLLGIIHDPQPSNNAWFSKLPSWWWHSIPLLFVLLILGKQLLKKRKQLALSNTKATLKKQALAQLEKEQGDFLKASAAYAERWLDPSAEPEVQEIITLRDESCFTPEESRSITSEQRSSILKTLTKFSCILLCFTLALQSAFADSKAARAWERNDYSAALKTYQDQQQSAPSADLLFNIGNCHYKLGNPGEAALAYQRALLLEPEHPEATQNLAFVTAPYDHTEPLVLSDLEDWINYFSQHTYLQIILGSLWLILLIFLTYKYLKPKKWRFTTVTIIAILAPIVLAISTYCYVAHPNKPQSKEAELAIILQSSELKSEPLRMADSITSVSPTAKCTIIASRGTWTYIELADSTRGWIRTTNVEAIKQ